MGHTSYSAKSWVDYSDTTKTKSFSDTFTRTSANGVHADLNPKGANRESRDSDIHPKSRLIVLCPDITGSMGFISKSLVNTELGKTFEYAVERSKAGDIFSDPHVMIMAVGDEECDRGPIQVTQAEADPVTLAVQTQNVWVEGGGGGNDHEGYHLPWYFAANHISMDCSEKRNEKGYLFTIGDEPPPTTLSKAAILAVFGDEVQADISAEDLYDMVSQKFEVYHIIIAEGSFAKGHPESVRKRWTKLIGQRALWLTDHTKLSELVVSTIQINEGIDKDTVIKSWGGDTSVVIAAATSGMVAATKSNTGVVKF